ncbi:Xaa-Pro dipeptidyl-peptidase [Vagococcus elongatus]|uniref:Xaa-Pro dipeptidyl-peptidase n=1 Tax=Vagococcus elongatus TaxID=180344 RepID=A0A430B612_9ENTE|nr:Xaa-Pro dipeptidyl-peptidase [Vagococcus elongatus]RSU15750.1 hypothetical protein CBF29_01375 [Vagococcus elongatus]
MTLSLHYRDDFLFERVFVETSLDTDNDGKYDLLAVYIRRPKDTRKGKKVPAIFMANPYMLGCNEDCYELCDVDKEISNVKESPTNYIKQSTKNPALSKLIPKYCVDESPIDEIKLQSIPEWYRMFSTWGYASVYSAGLGTYGSDGFNSTGSVDEITAFKDVIEWLGGRRRAFTDRTGITEIKAHWCNGNVAMTGKSYVGTLAIGVACTGVKELKTIIPEAAISNWYHYYRQNGMPVPSKDWQGDDIFLLSQYCFSRRLDIEDYPNIAFEYRNKLSEMRNNCARESGNYNSFWDERNYLNKIDNLRASVLLIHGLNDWNVKTNQFSMFWHELEKRNIPRKLLLHQGDHIFIHNHQTIDFSNLIRLWLDYWLYEANNNVMNKFPKVHVQSNIDQFYWYQSSNWPTKDVKPKVINLHCENNEFYDDLSAAGYNREKDNQSEWLNNIVEEPNKIKSFRLASKINEIEKETRICGTVRVNLEAAVNKSTGILSAMLIDYGRSLRLDLATETAVTEGLDLGVGAGKMDIIRFSAQKKPGDWMVISRGWLNIQNRSSLSIKENIEPDKYHSYSIEMMPTDYTLKEGHSLGLILYGADAEFTLRPFSTRHIRLKNNSLKITIPCVLTGF